MVKIPKLSLVSFRTQFRNLWVWFHGTHKAHTNKAPGYSHLKRRFKRLWNTLPRIIFFVSHLFLPFLFRPCSLLASLKSLILLVPGQNMVVHIRMNEEEGMYTKQKQNIWMFDLGKGHYLALSFTKRHVLKASELLFSYKIHSESPTHSFW